MCGECPHAGEDRALVLRADAKIPPQRGDGKSRAEVLPERFVRTGNGRQERRLEHRLEPLHADLRVPEDALKMRIERAHVEERFVDIENENAFHNSAERVGFEPTELSLTDFPGLRPKPD